MKTKSDGSTAHSHYYKDVSGLRTIDVYRVLDLFGVTDPCLQHATKKLLVAGGRGHKDIERDVQDAIDSLNRWKDMRREESPAALKIDGEPTQAQKEALQKLVEEGEAMGDYAQKPISIDHVSISPVRASGDWFNAFPTEQHQVWSKACEFKLPENMQPTTTITTPPSTWPDDTRIDAIGQNGNEGEHYLEVPSWDDVQEHYQWMAQDEEGDWYAYETEPEHEHEAGQWSDESRYCCYVLSGNKNPNWRNTLQKRPTTEAQTTKVPERLAVSSLSKLYATNPHKDANCVVKCIGASSYVYARTASGKTFWLPGALENQITGVELVSYLSEVAD